ncbi:mitochondrial calcium uniporter regulator 1-like [Mercenaria mercenaria]|uniref:mitochondrial calcium uniporter regulator 1-like n=1 Tax=Mercenaria mercenaria TaxID=6596 RepID=UPI001E1DCB16|nr:mitochondrial calcium uniporter regulator 1-like [Mercenaria mercenaria]
MRRLFCGNRHLLQQFVGQPSKLVKEIRESKTIGLRCRYMCQSVEKSGEARSIDPAATRQSGVTYYLDTLAVSKKLLERGFNREEAEAMTEVLSDVVGTVIDHQTKIMVTKLQQEIMVQQLLAQIASVKKDMVILEKSEFTMIRNDTEKQGILIKHLEGQLEDGIKKLEGQVKLDINLEKSRAVEAHALNEKQLQALINRMDVDHAKTEKNLQALENKIEVSVSNIRTQNEKNRNDVQKYLMGLVLSGATVFLAYLRLIA